MFCHVRNASSTTLVRDTSSSTRFIISKLRDASRKDCIIIEMHMALDLCIKFATSECL